MRVSTLLFVTAAVVALACVAPATAQGTVGRVVVEAVDVAEHKAASLLGKTANEVGDSESTSRAIGTRFTEALARGEVDALRNSLVANALKKFTGKTNEPLLKVLRSRAEGAGKKSEWEPIIARIEKEYAGNEAGTNFAVLTELMKARKPLGATSIDEISYVLLHKAEKTPLNAEERAFILTVTRDIKGAPPALVRFETRYMTPELKNALTKADETIAKFKAKAAKWPKSAPFPWKAQVAEVRAMIKIPDGVSKSMMNAVDRPDTMLGQIDAMEKAAVEARDSLHRLTEEATAARATLIDAFETTQVTRRMEAFDRPQDRDVTKSVTNAATRLENIATTFAKWASKAPAESSSASSMRVAFSFSDYAEKFNAWAAKNAQKLRNGGAEWDVAYDMVHATKVEAYARDGCTGGECGMLLAAMTKARQAMEAAQTSAASKFWDTNHKTIRDVLMQEAREASAAFDAKYGSRFAGREYSGLWGSTRYETPSSFTGQTSSVAKAPQWAGDRGGRLTYSSYMDTWRFLWWW